jgi:transcription initiation factor TFIIB
MNENFEFDNLFDELKIQQNLKKTTNIDNIENCTNCDNELTNIEGEMICEKCGIINYGLIDFNAEWRYYGSEDSKFSDPTRCGLPTNALLPESSLGSSISFKYGESYDMRKIRNYHLWNAMPYKERSLYNVFDAIQVRAINNGIPICIIEEAKLLYKKISEIRIHRGSNRSGIIAACVREACMLQGSPRSTKEIADIFKIKIKHMTRGCKKFQEIMNLSICDTESYKSKCTKPIDFIHRFCSKLNLGSNIFNICNQVCINADKYNLVSKCIPPSIAAGSIFLVCNLLNINITKKEISVHCKISEVTISKCYKSLYLYHEYILPKNILEKLYPNKILPIIV